MLRELPSRGRDAQKLWQNRQFRFWLIRKTSSYLAKPILFGNLYIAILRFNNLFFDQFFTYFLNLISLGVIFSNYYERVFSIWLSVFFG